MARASWPTEGTDATASARRVGCGGERRRRRRAQCAFLAIRHEHGPRIINNHFHFLSINSLIQFFIYSFIHLFLYSFTNLFVHVFNYSFILLCMYSFIHVYISHSSIYVYSYVHLCSFFLLFVSLNTLRQFFSLLSDVPSEK